MMGGFDLILLGIGVVIGMGVMVFIGIMVVKNVGFFVIFFFIIAVVVCSFAVLCYVEIVFVFLVYGSVYIYFYIIMGEIIGYLMGWMFLFVYMVMVFVVVSGWLSYFNNLLVEIGMFLLDSLLYVLS